MRRAVLLVLLVACGQSPDDLFVLAGRAIGVDGAGVDGLPVAVLQVREASQAPLRTARTADGGAFSFDLARVEVESLSGEDAWWTHLETSFPSGTSAWIDVAYLPNRLELPPLYDWQRGFFVDDAGVLTFTPITPTGPDCPGGTPEEGRFVHVLMASNSEGNFWQQSDLTVRDEDAGYETRAIYAPAPVVLTPDMVEDQILGLTLQARRFDCFTIAGGGGLLGTEQYSVVSWWHNPDFHFLKGALRPPSRGADCPGVQTTPCPLTDGVATAVHFPTPLTTFRVQLAAPIRVRTIIFRNAVSLFDLPRASRLTVRAGGEAVTVPMPADWVPFYEALIVAPDTVARIEWKRIVLPEAMPVSTQVEVELDQPLLQLGELSLFE